MGDDTFLRNVAMMDAQIMYREEESALNMGQYAKGAAMMDA
eukprot:CAMPEP_0181105152 /NCGR_PEP_ID=MMETSP1071-20121207/15816_1 /TAXON_ID=35127 /ORGANISM="Thalassiosira sp., Strain NH16" /LENGTH=40 /DNA_ID= /DNA_START= /DNA_END= /DNA_ORIENTATION=